MKGMGAIVVCFQLNQFAKVEVAGSNPVSRFSDSITCESPIPTLSPNLEFVCDENQQFRQRIKVD